MGSEVLGIGITGRTLTDLERSIIRERTPYAVVLFGRNIGSVSQLRELVADVKSLSPKPPLLMIDEEGGRVDRLRDLLPGLPSAEAFLEGEDGAGLSEWLGKLIGMALRYFEIDVNLAPVVDVRREAAPKGLERRTFSDDPQEVADLAGAFMRGHHAAGVATCLKHWPGIGAGSADPHYGATIINLTRDELIANDLVPFRQLAPLAGAVMIGHGAYPQIDAPDLPATLSWRVTTDLLRNELGFKGIAVSDDMEMHAVSDLGTYEETAERALLAGNDSILFCSHVERIPEIDSHLRRRVANDPVVSARFAEAVVRCEAYRAHCAQLRAAAPVVSSFDELIEEATRFVDHFQETRPPYDDATPDVDRRKYSRTPGTGRTGREEWT